MTCVASDASLSSAVASIQIRVEDSATSSVAVEAATALFEGLEDVATAIGAAFRVARLPRLRFGRSRLVSTRPVPVRF